MSPTPVTMHGLDADLVDHLVQRVREVLQDQDRACTGITQLVLQFARRVQWDWC